MKRKMSEKRFNRLLKIVSLIINIIIFTPFYVIDAKLILFTLPYLIYCTLMFNGLFRVGIKASKAKGDDDFLKSYYDIVEKENDEEVKQEVKND